MDVIRKTGPILYEADVWDASAQRWRKEERATTWDEVFAAVEAYKELFGELERRFFERSSFLRKLRFAIIMRENVLVWGDTGTGKTSILKALSRAIDGAVVFETAMSEYLTDSDLYGEPNIKEAHDTGRIRRFMDGTIRSAHIAALDEFYDAHIGMLRTLLRPLGDREYHRGLDRNGLPLFTAIAATNESPFDAIEREPRLAAVNDRFLFWEEVRDVQGPRARSALAKMRLTGEFGQPYPPITLAQVELISDIVLYTDLFAATPQVVDAYEEVTRRFAEETGRRISTRRFVEAAPIMEVAALLDFRTEVDWNDIDIASLIFVEKPEDEGTWISVRDSAISAWQKDREHEIAQLDVTKLQNIRDRLPPFGDVDILDAGGLINLKRELVSLESATRGVDTTSQESSKDRKALLELIREMASIVDHKINTGETPKGTLDEAS